MISIPSDPVQDLIDRAKALWIKAAFQFELNTEIIAPGMHVPENAIVTPQLFYERLDTEDIIRSRVAQYRRSQALVQRTKTLCASLFASKRV